MANDTLMREQAGMRTGVRALVTRKELSASFLHMEGNACLSAVKPAEDGAKDAVVRLYNPTGTAASIRLWTDRRGSWQYCDLLEQVTETAASEASGQMVSVRLEPGKIQTLRFSAEI